MKIASAKIPQCFLFVFLIIFVGMPLPLQLTSQAKSPIPASKKELNPISDTTERPVSLDEVATPVTGYALMLS
jgi:hypothetical protein